MVIRTTRKPASIIMEWPDVIGREPFRIYNEAEALGLAYQFIEALRVFREEKPIVRTSQS